MQKTTKDSARGLRRHSLNMALLAGTAALALAFPAAAQAALHGGGHDGGHIAGGHFAGAHFGGGHFGGGHFGAPHIAAATHTGGWHGGGWHEGSWHHRGGWGGWSPDYVYDYDWGYPDYGWSYPDYYGAPSYNSAWYCPNPAGYYPYVSQCYTQWEPAG